MPIRMFFPAALAQLDPLGTPSASVARSFGQQLNDVLLVVAAGLGIGVLLFVWARYVRRKPRSRRSESSASHRSAGTDNDEDAEDDSPSARRRKKRRRLRRDHRPRNPTLADTGGLPPPAGDPPRSAT